jgi:hypothetical protein
MWIDQESGYLLGEDNEHPDAVGSRAWIEDPEIGVPLDDALFVWDGPTVTPEKVEAAQTADHRALEVSQRAWFRGHIEDRPPAGLRHSRPDAEAVCLLRRRDVCRRQ